MTKKISIIMGSISDADIARETGGLLKKFKAPYEVKILSAHRSPKELEKYVKQAPQKGIKVFIAAAGGAAALAGVIASHTILPVIGVPVETKSLKGLDSLLSTVQMPSGVPVAAMAIGKSGAKNAAIFALEILALENKTLQKQIFKFKQNLKAQIKKARMKL